MSNSEPTSLGMDPDDTQPFAAQPSSPGRRVEPGAAWAVDEAAPDLARLGAGWARRDRSVDELVGLVSHCRCRPKVIPRTALSSRVAPGPLLDALRGIRTQRGRLAVVETWPDVRADRWRPHREHHIALPSVAAQDTRGVFEPLSAERRDLLDRCIALRRTVLRGVLIQKLYDVGTPDALYASADYLELGGAIHLHRRDVPLPDDEDVLDAAEYEAVPGKLLCIVRPDGVWRKSAAAWIDMTQLNLRIERDPCVGG